MTQKPSNWYGMTSDEQRAWEKQARAIEDLEYEADQAKQSAERASADAQRQQRSFQQRSSEYREAIDAITDECDEARAEATKLRKQRDELLAACKAMAAWGDREYGPWELIDAAIAKAEQLLAISSKED